MPFNLFGVMTLGNPYILPNMEIATMMDKLWEKSEKWFHERFVEEIIMAAIGNSGAEGYFALIRKLFMLVLAWRRKEQGANWNINSYSQGNRSRWSSQNLMQLCTRVGFTLPMQNIYDYRRRRFILFAIFSFKYLSKRTTFLLRSLPNVMAEKN